MQTAFRGQTACALRTVLRPSPLAGSLARPVARPLRVESKKGDNRGKAVAKENLPTKVCATCGLPFTWRKKWEKVWDEVRYCSDRCRGNRGKSAAAAGAPGSDSD
ncbi:hypothetical protein CHLRE_04g212350v5 [Chlamydomonas reinhardtii]|uniref:DUF2256 domain-containing protein n=1 Tax=Chlamydomonas reinhardtii TaxID=3055 RepID=A0A2K3DTZ0_CHLRE|nr:uncharacterized protein CHLRE_04g212350v5 [Chlamydomonas reinhardtii]PNW83999.1 hypothetical protein CHLRE_04g212350v5 [Chlamydomonas reinhardtii]